MAGIVAKHGQQMKFCNPHLTRNIFNLYMRRFFFGLVYKKPMLTLSSPWPISVESCQMLFHGLAWTQAPPNTYTYKLICQTVHTLDNRRRQANRSASFLENRFTDHCFSSTMEKCVLYYGISWICKRFFT